MPRLTADRICLRLPLGVESRQVIVNFNGGTVTSDGGLMLIAALDQKRQITSRFAACFQDYRDPARVEHSVKTLVAQRVYGLVQGYEDLNDHDQLRHDPMFAVALGKLSAKHKDIKKRTTVYGDLSSHNGFAG